MLVKAFGEIFGLGVPELVVILVILVLLFGGKKLPQLSRSVGQSVKELRSGFSESTKKKDSDSKSKKV